MKQFLSDGQIQLTKSLGQNFLHDANQLRRIVDAAVIKPEDQILEIGPGLGPLTELLVAKGNPVLAIEKDRRLYDFLLQKFAGVKNLTLICADALEWLRQEPRDWSAWKLVANLPYSVASPLLVDLARMEQRPKRLTITLQAEVARRIVATAGDDDYGKLSLYLQVHYAPEGFFKIPAECFFPEPDVESACVTLARREPPLLQRQDHARFAQLVTLGFSQRRKMMFKLLKSSWPVEKLEQAFDQVGLSRQIRAEKVTLAEFIQFTEILRNP